MRVSLRFPPAVRRDESRRGRHECLRHVWSDTLLRSDSWRTLSACRVHTRVDTCAGKMVRHAR